MRYQVELKARRVSVTKSPLIKHFIYNNYTEKNCLSADQKFKNIAPKNNKILFKPEESQ